MKIHKAIYRGTSYLSDVHLATLKDIHQVRNPAAICLHLYECHRLVIVITLNY